jgi:hypothetical protein
MDQSRNHRMPNIEILLHDPGVLRDGSGLVTRWLLRVPADRRRVCPWQEWVGKSGAHGLRIHSLTIMKREIT